MKTIGNIIWFILGGVIGGLTWILVGLTWCVTIIGIPVGKQCFKLASISFFPFGKKIIYGQKASSVILNILWIVFGGIEIAVGYLIAGVIFCCTIVGIPFGKQCFKIMKLAFIPFGAKIEK